MDTDRTTTAGDTGNPIPTSNADLSGVLRDFARGALVQLQAEGSIAPAWGFAHPVIHGTGPLGASDVLNFLDDGFRDQRERAGVEPGAGAT